MNTSSTPPLLHLSSVSLHKDLQNPHKQVWCHMNTSSTPPLHLSFVSLHKDLQNPHKARQWRNKPTNTFCSTSTTQQETLLAKNDLLSLISDEQRGVKTQGNPSKQSKIIKAIEAMEVLGKGSTTTDSSLSATWRMLWTTEKEQLFIINNANFFGTETGDVLQVIDVENKVLNNVITFPPSGVFFVRSNIEIASPQRVNFKFTSAVLRGKDWEFPLPPFGQGWFENIFIDNEIRVAKDIRGDYLVVDRAPYSWKE